MRTAMVKGLFILVLGGVFLAGCASEAAKKNEISASKTSLASTAGPATVKSAPNRSETSTGSSLEALREGKPPASGPLKEIYFDFDSYALSAEARSILKANAAWLKANPSSQVEIEGHCDERGTTEYNLALGAKRARGAMDYLVSLGISPARIKTVSYGEELPACQEKSEECYRHNRHDRFVLPPGRPGA